MQDVEKNVTDQEQRYLKYICKSSAFKTTAVPSMLRSMALSLKVISHVQKVINWPGANRSTEIMLKGMVLPRTLVIKRYLRRGQFCSF